ncbi:MAG: aspartyl/glutamyl-tRNA amidotransferase subunit C [Desulfurococcales archaeon]|nr:aspartyl/glutamyl-tRNA amidotransferase subunit C [Desulfurococcales archaeon]
MECSQDLLERLASLAKLKLDREEAEEICRSIPRIAEYLRKVSKIPGIVEAEPLYHVWEEESRLLDDSPNRRVDLASLPVDVDDGYVKAPWRGGRR